MGAQEEKRVLRLGVETNTQDITGQVLQVDGGMGM